MPQKPDPDFADLIKPGMRRLFLNSFTSTEAEYTRWISIFGLDPEAKVRKALEELLSAPKD